MKLYFIINRIAKYLVVLILIALFIFLLYWLWQRQPKPKTSLATQASTTQIQSQKQENNPTVLPEDFSILTSNPIEIETKALPDSIVAIYSNDFAIITSSDDSGNVRAQTNLNKGLNLINVATISKDFVQNDQKSLSYYLGDSLNEEKTVYTGTVKTIFDTLITIDTPVGVKSIVASRSTTINLPPSVNGENEPTGSPLKNIRIGDNLTVLGDLTGNKENEQLQAKKIEVARENIPQNMRKLALTKTLTAVRQNLFSAKNTIDNKILEFNLTKNSKIQIEDKNAKASDISKDKNAIVIYHPDNEKNIVDLIYLLP